MPIISAFPTGESTVDYTGPKSSLPSLEEGKIGYVTDEKRLYTGNADGTNTQIPNADDLSAHTSNKENPHGVTAEQVGADAKGSAAQSLADAKKYTDTVGKDKIKLINSEVIVEMPSNGAWTSVCHGNGKFVAVAAEGNTVAYSEDGTVWTQATMPVSKNWMSICYGNGKFVAVASSTNIAAYSTDGINWTQTTMPASKSWSSVCYGNDKFVAVAQSSNIAAYSTDGINWTQTTMPASVAWSSVCYGNGKFVTAAAQNNSNIAAYSTDGINWTQTTMPVYRSWFVCYGNGKFVAVTYESDIAAYSTDGINWTETTMPDYANWLSVCYGNGKFVAVTYGDNKAAYSTDGINWTQTTMPGSANWQSVCHGAGKFVAVTCEDNKAAYSTDGVVWADRYVFKYLQNSSGEDISEDVKSVLDISADDVGADHVGAAVAAVSEHNSNADAHADKFAKYLPLEGGEMTGAIVVTNNYNKYSALETPTGYTYIDIYDDGKDVTTGTTEMHTVVGKGAGYLTGEHLVMDGAGIDLRRYNGTIANTQVALKLNAESNTVRIEQVGTISDNSDVTTKKYVDDAISEANTNYLPLEGGTMTGSIIAPSNTSAIRNSTNSSRVSIHDETAGLASGTVSVLCNSSNSDNPNLTLSAGSTNLYVSNANGTVQMTRTKDITHDNDITDKKYVDSAIGSISPSACKVTLSASGWDSTAKTQSATVSGVLEDESKQLIMPMPAGTSMSAYNEAGIQMTAQAANTVTFTADTVPTTSIDVWVVFQNVNDVTPPPPPPLDEASWEYISQQSLAGNAKNIWAVGDCKKIKLSGTASKLSLNTELYVYILDFDHDSSTVGGTKDGITFGTFKTALTDGKDVCLLSGYNDDSDFRMNTTNANSGGWKNSDMRYNILGSTNTQNGNATATTATSPKSNTLMSCLPADLRAVMRPMCVYTDNTGGGSDTASYVTTTIDFLPLLAEFEIHGARTHANSAEQNNQTQYSYFKNGSSKVKYMYDSQSSTMNWWSRSPYSDNSSYFCYVNTIGSAKSYIANLSYGVSPAFKV